MPIQKSFTKTDSTTGNFWRLEAENVSVRGSKIVEIWSLYASSAAFSAGSTPMRSLAVERPLSIFTAAQLNTIKNVCEADAIANGPVEINGGTIV